MRVTDANGTTSSRLATLDVVAAATPCDDPAEPNNGSLTATALALGATTSGFICSSPDVDWFKVVITESGQLNLALTVPDGLDYDLELYGPDATWVTGSYEETGQAESIVRTVSPGNYYARVYSHPLGQGLFSASQAYQLSANAAAVQPPGPTSGPISSAVVWSGVVELSGDVTIMSGGSLKLMPGTQVRCASSDDRASGNDSSRVEIIVNGGTLEASGAPDAFIRFTSRAQNPFPGNWHGIRVVEGDVTMTHCVVEYAVDGVRFEDSDTRFNSYALGNVTVQRCSGSGVWTTSGQYALVTLNNFQLWTNGTGLSANGPVTLVGGQLVGNNGSGFSGNSATLVAAGTIMSRNAGIGVYNGNGSTTLTGCIVTNNQSVGVYGYQCSLNLDGCTVIKNSGAGVSAYRSPINMSACTVSQNTGWGVDANQDCCNLPVEVWNNLVQSNASGGLTLGNVTVGVVSNTISGNLGTGLQLTSFGVSASGITGNVIRGNGGVGILVSGGGPAPTRISGNDIYQNTNFELRNDSSIAITATSCYWAEPTSTELNQNQANLSRIYDQRDNSSYGLVTVQNPRFVPIGQVFGTPPNITQHPQSQTKLAGSTVTFTVAASGSTPFSYQWRKNGNPISGGAGATLALLNVQTGDAGTYSVVVSNSAGTATSSNATLNVTAVPANLAVRTILRTGEVFSVSLAISPPTGAGFGFVQEVLPVGFTATGINAGGTYNPLTGIILWGPMPDNQIHQLSYTLGLPVGFVDSTTLNGTAYFFGTSQAVTGDSIVSTLPPDTRARLTMTRLAGFFAVSIEGEVGRTYRVEARDNLASGQWEPLATVTMFTSPRVYIDADSISKTRRFYRTVLIE